ncbi:PTS transporter subunit EIIC [Spiroplasma chrysopicola]|uniref:PTS system N-acetylglucosamine-specific IIB component n=1 Tax=Spiroplasma chrysopicola DF-1 TaxID=1276227 RepID=R4UIB5_9MOLU|nr:PTS transporter subunit EIIC [Spiroplasma chrysopicola]AGM25056.1 PTS system N-acetylglucosamine-specific IIB component [Spiroplasma chrysopicola DF-1]
MQYLQKLGKALQFPIVVLPVAALLVRIGVLMTDSSLNSALTQTGSLAGIWYVGAIFNAVGSAALNNLAPLFAIGLGFGMAKDFRGEAALVAFFGWAVITGLMAIIPQLYYSNVMKSYEPIGNFNGEAKWTEMHSQILYVFDFNSKAADGTYGAKYNIDMGVFGGILAGSCVALIYNRYQDVKLPAALGFFSGRRFVPMVTVFFFLLGGFVIAAVWPWLQLALQYLGYGLGAIPPLGAFFYGIFNRLLIPFGLHQVLNTYLWFQQPIVGHLMSMNGVPLWQITDGVLQWAVYHVENGIPIIDGWNSTGIVETMNGDINAFLGQLYADAKFGLAGGSGIFQTGFFPMMMFGLPAACAAMILSVEDKGKRAEVAGILGSSAGISFLTGVTEPIEFSFIFLAPILLGLHALITGVFAAITVGFGIRAGFGFSAGFVDWAVSIKTSWDMSTISGTLQNPVYKVLGNPLMILPIGIAEGAVYFFSFKWLIKKLNLATPGREEQAAVIAKKLGKTVEKHANKKKKEENIQLATSAGPVMASASTTIATRFDLKKDPEGAAKMAKVIYDAIGHDNLEKVDNCMTRLRLTVKDNTIIDQQKIKDTGVAGLVLVSKNKGIQIIVGVYVESVAKELSKISGK